MIFEGFLTPNTSLTEGKRLLIQRLSGKDHVFAKRRAEQFQADVRSNGGQLGEGGAKGGSGETHALVHSVSVGILPFSRLLLNSFGNLKGAVSALIDKVIQ
mgnify:CR=1 FL=1